MTATSEEEVRHDTIYFSGSAGCGISDFQYSPAFVGKSRRETGSGEAAGAQPEDCAGDVSSDSAYQRSAGYSQGQERIPEGPVLYVGNHQSYFDILVGYTTVPTLLGFVAKKEMERYILLRDWMRNVNCLFLDRTDIKAEKTILDGIQKIKAGISVWIFPEGTRNINEDVTELLPFKEGKA